MLIDASKALKLFEQAEKERRAQFQQQIDDYLDSLTPRIEKAAFEGRRAITVEFPDKLIATKLREEIMKYGYTVIIDEKIASLKANLTLVW